MLNQARSLEGNGPLDELRRLIEKTDSRLGGLERASADDALALLRMFDEMDTLHTTLSADDVDLRAENSRLDTIQLILHRKAGLLLRLLGQKGGIAALRKARAPARERWWWYLDEYVSAQRKQTLRNLARTGVILIILFAVAAAVYQTWFQPDPAVIARLNYTSDAQRAIEAGNLNVALQEMEKATAQFPNDGEIQIWHGAVLSLMKRTQEADAAFQTARQLYPDETTYLIARATVRTQANDIDAANADALAATKLSPDNAQAFLVLGGTQELKGQTQNASQSYSTAASLAAAAKQSELEAMAKVRLAMMMQAAPPIVFSTPQPTP
jgi:tetratricopeptide (TPR) repeat protein